MTMQERQIRLFDFVWSFIRKINKKFTREKIKSHIVREIDFLKEQDFRLILEKHNGKKLKTRYLNLKIRGLSYSVKNSKNNE